MFKFSIGFNGDRGFRQVVEKYRNHIADVYFSPPFTPSGRGMRGGTGEYIYALIMHEFLQYAKDTGVETNLLLNALCAGGSYGSPRQAKVVLNAVALHKQNYNTRSVTVVSPIDGELIKREFPDMKVHVSVNMFIRNVAQARNVSHFADVLILDRNVNRDLQTIEAIRKDSGKHIRLLANESCLIECMNRIQHFNRIAHDIAPSSGRHLPCGSRYFSDRATLIKAPIIRPEDLHHYEGLADSIKLATRTTPNEKIDLALAAYVSGRFNGSLFQITESNGLAAYIAIAVEQSKGTAAPYFDNSRIPPDFFEKVTRCDRICERCGYCDRVAERAFRMEPIPPGAANDRKPT